MPSAAKKLESEVSPSAGAEVVVTPVQSEADRAQFIRFPYRLYQGDPNWVPPLMMERRDFLNPKKNPWFEFGQVELLLARRGGEVVGRIAAVRDPRYNEFHQTQLGFFGMFECINDVAVARALFDAAAAWNRSQGFAQMIGPLNFSTNYECGVLIEGFDAPPVILMAYNPRYYPQLYQAAGFEKAKDLWAFELSSSAPPPPKVVRIAESIRRREGVTVRPINIKDFEGELQRVKGIYNAAWEKNWGFVPMTDREFDHLAHELRPLVVPELIMLAEVNQEPVAFVMTIPDANLALKAANGRLTQFGLPIGLIRLMLASRKIKRLRLVTLGVKEGFRKRGLDAILYLDTIQTARRLGYSGGEISWTLEDNDLINRSIQLMGGRRYKSYRLYQRAT